MIAILALAIGLAAAGCSGGEEELTGLAAEGRTIAANAGCVACHGANGQGGVGPAWVGLAGSSVKLEDGSTVEADTAYLRRAIVSPDAEIVAGFTVMMPAAQLTEAEVDALLAYIEELR